MEKDTFYILGSQFDGCAGGKLITEVLGNVVGVDYDGDFLFQETASQIQVPKAAGGYDTYYFLNDGWYDDGTEEGNYKAGWCDGFGNIAADAEIPTGVAMWFKNKVEDNSSWTHSGAVPAKDAIRVEMPESFQLRNNPFPTVANMNGEKVDSAEVVGVDYDGEFHFQETASQIQVPKAAGGYDTYYFLNDGWYDDGTEEGNYKAGWCDGFGNIADIQIPVMQGFWTKAVSGAGAITFSM